MITVKAKIVITFGERGGCIWNRSPGWASGMVGKVLHFGIVVVKRVFSL